MKNFQYIFGLWVVSLALNIFAVTTGDEMKFTMNRERTHFLVSDASGKLKVLNRIDNDVMGKGYEIQLDYDIDVKLKGHQKGSVKIFLPDPILANNYYDVLEGMPMQNFGMFTIKHDGKQSVKLGGKTYDCHAIKGLNIDHNFKGKDKASVTSFVWDGRIEWVTHMVIDLKTHSSMKVLGILQIDVAARSDSGIDFNIGMDPVIR